MSNASRSGPAVSSRNPRHLAGRRAARPLRRPGRSDRSVPWPLVIVNGRSLANSHSLGNRRSWKRGMRGCRFPVVNCQLPVRSQGESQNSVLTAVWARLSVNFGLHFTFLALNPQRPVPSPSPLASRSRRVSTCRESAADGVQRSAESILIVRQSPRCSPLPSWRRRLPAILHPGVLQKAADIRRP